MKKRMLSSMGKVCLIFASIIMLVACNKSEEGPAGIYSNGLFIVNEGVWGQNNGSISFFDPNKPDSIKNNIFAKANPSIPLGDVIQSMNITGDEAWIVGNTNNNIVVVDRHSFELLSIIEGSNNPRHLVFSNGTAYLTSWGDGGVVLTIDIETKHVTDTIEVGTGPERMLINNNQLFIVNSGGYMRDSTVSIVDVATNIVTKTVKTGDNPTDLILDNAGNLWVLCFGYIDYGSAPDYNFTHVSGSQLVKIDGSLLETVQTIPIADDLHPMHLETDKTGENLFVGGGYGFPGVFKLSVDDDVFPTEPLIDYAAYAIQCNKKSDVLYIFDAGNFTTAGKMFRYSMNGELVNELEPGIGPNSICVTP